MATHSFLCAPEQSEQGSPNPSSGSNLFSVILTEASERSLRGRISDSFAKRSRYRFQVSASNSGHHPIFSRFPLYVS